MRVKALLLTGRPRSSERSPRSVSGSPSGRFLQPGSWALFFASAPSGYVRHASGTLLSVSFSVLTFPLRVLHHVHSPPGRAPLPGELSPRAALNVLVS